MSRPCKRPTAGRPAIAPASNTVPSRSTTASGPTAWSSASRRTDRFASATASKPTRDAGRRVTVDPLHAGVDADRPATTRDAVRTLTADGDGSWSVDGTDAPELDGCLDVDVAVTPLTNALPIRRLGLEPGASATVDAVYLDPLGGEVTATRQRYTHLERVETGSRYRYEGLESGFSAEVVVDDAAS